MNISSTVKAILLLYIATFLSIVFDIDGFRQVLGMFYFTFVIGYLLFQLFQLNIKGYLITLLFSCGLSIAVFMFSGLLLNELSSALNFSLFSSKPAILIVLSALTIIPLLFSNKWPTREIVLPSFDIDFLNILQYLMIIIVPLLSIYGTISRNVPLLLVVIIIIPIWIIFSLYFKKLNPRLYPIIILSVACALLFQTELLTPYFFGSDIFLEFNSFRSTQITGFWVPSGAIAYYSALSMLSSVVSISILPILYVNALAIDSEAFFKVFYPIVFALVSVALYKLYEKNTSGKFALIAAFFFMSSPIVFFGSEALSLSRQIMAEFFFILFMLVVVNQELSQMKKDVLLLIFGTALIVSHYSMAFIFLFYLVFIFIFSNVKTIEILRVKTKSLKLSLILILALITFLWYIYVSEAPFDQLVFSINRIFNLFSSDFLDAEARVQPSLMVLSPFTTTTTIGLIHKVLTYIEESFIVIGVLVLLVKPKIFNFSSELRAVAISSMLILSLCLIIPNFAPTMNFTRFYSIVLPFLAPFCILGGIILLDYLEKVLKIKSIKSRRINLTKINFFIITSIVLVTFIFNAGFMNHVTNGYPYSYSLDIERRQSSNDIGVLVDTYGSFVNGHDVFGAKWLGSYMNRSALIYSDYFSQVTTLMSYTVTIEGQVNAVTNETVLQSNDYVFLNYVNTMIGVAPVDRGNGIEITNTTDVSPVIAEFNVIYSNGGSNIYCKP